MKFDKNDRSALAGTVLFHLAVFLLLLCLAPLRTVMPEDGGVLVNFGNLNMAAGVFEPRGQRAPVSTPVPEVTPPKTTRPVPPPRAEMITQDEEETVTLTDRKEEERKKREEAERKKREEERLAEQRRREEQRRQSQAIQNQVAGAFGSGNADGDSQGDAPAGTGNQGNPFGNSDSGANEGAGGNGTFFDLNGRSIGAGGLPRPSYTGQEEGRIVISITVDPKGNVIMAEIGRGTNIVDGTMRSAALGAAKRAKFNSIVGTNNQSGTITYHYRYLSN